MKKIKKAIGRGLRHFHQLKGKMQGLKTRYELLNHLIEKHGYKDYLEIGVEHGFCIKSVKALNKTGVDPNPLIDHVIGANIMKMTSDDFFKQNNDKYDLIFIDGLHTHEQSYKDFQKATHRLRDNGRIVLHDCNPETEEYARSFAEGGKWNGDVFKTLMKINASGDFTAYTVDIDHGCGVIELTPDNEHFDYEATYDWFDKNRKKAINLISWEEFLEK